jgi:hypothetical protein
MGVVSLFSRRRSLRSVYILSLIAKRRPGLYLGLLHRGPVIVRLPREFSSINDPCHKTASHLHARRKPK